MGLRLGGDLLKRRSPRLARRNVLGNVEAWHGGYGRDPHRLGLDFIMDVNERAGGPIAFCAICNLGLAQVLLGRQVWQMRIPLFESLEGLGDDPRAGALVRRAGQGLVELDDGGHAGILLRSVSAIQADYNRHLTAMIKEPPWLAGGRMSADPRSRSKPAYPRAPLGTPTSVGRPGSEEAGTLYRSFTSAANAPTRAYGRGFTPRGRFSRIPRG